MGKGGGGGGGTTVTNTVATPWVGQQPYLTNIYEDAQKIYNTSKSTPYTGDFVAGANPLQTQAIAGSANLANQSIGMGNQTNQIANQLAGNLQSGKYTDALYASNEDVAKELGASTAGILQNYQENVIPQMTSQAVNQGAYGGARQNLLSEQIGDSFAKEISNAAITNAQARRALIPQAMFAEGALASKIPSLTNQGYSLNQQPYTSLGAAGDAQSAIDQNLLANQYRKWQQANAAPWSDLSNYAGIIQGGGYGSTSGTASMPGQSSSTIAGALGGGLVGGLAGATIPQALGYTAFGPWGIAGSAALGALGGGFLS